MKTKTAFIVVDLGFGDAGKGLVTDALVRERRAHTVVRFNGGAQAGHNVVTSDGRHHTFSQLGAGSFVPGVTTILSRHVAIHPTSLLVEADRLARIGVSDALARVVVDERARVTTPFHQAANRLREIARGAGRHGSCGIGFGETIADAEAGHVITAADLRDVVGLRALLIRMRDRKRAELDGDGVMARAGGSVDASRERAVFESPHVIDAWLDQLAPFRASVRVADARTLKQALAVDGTTVFEGAQGVLLDEWYGFHPHTTWSTCTFDNARSLLHEHGYAGDVVRLGVLRTVAVRHGAGPMPTASAALDAQIGEPHNHLGPWQGAMRHGHPDLVLLRYALAVTGGVDALAITHLDTAARLDGLALCSSYHDGAASIAALTTAPAPNLEHQESLTRLLDRISPDLEPLPHGDAGALEVVARYATEAGAPVVMLARGPRAEDVSFPLMEKGSWGRP